MRLIDQAFQCVGGQQIALHQRRRLCAQCVQLAQQQIGFLAGVIAMQNDIGASEMQGACNRRSDALGAAGNKDGFGVCSSCCGLWGMRKLHVIFAFVFTGLDF